MSSLAHYSWYSQHVPNAYFMIKSKWESPIWTRIRYICGKTCYRKYTVFQMIPNHVSAVGLYMEDIFICSYQCDLSKDEYPYFSWSKLYLFANFKIAVAHVSVPDSAMTLGTMCCKQSTARYRRARGVRSYPCELMHRYIQYARNHNNIL
jgi:hypothetical protein